MAYSIQREVSDGTLVLLDISINYVERSEISVLFDGIVQVGGDTWDWVGTVDAKLSFTPAVGNGVEVAVVRQTDLSDLRHRFSEGAAFTANSMDEALEQVLHIAQESAEQLQVTAFYNDLDMHGYRVKNVGGGVDPGDAATVGQMTVHDTTIVGYRDQTLTYRNEAEGFADDAEASAIAAAGVVTTHVSQADPHTQYVLESAIGTTVQAYSAILDSIATGATASKNKIINGKMEIAQRGLVFYPLGVGSAHTLDRWAWVGVGTTALIAVLQQTDVPSNEFQCSLRLTVNTEDDSIAAGDMAYIDQRIEGLNARDLIGRTFTLSFWVKSPKAGTHCVFFSNSNSDRSFVAEYTVSVAGAWEKQSITVPGGLITTGTWNWGVGLGLQVGFVLAAGTAYQTSSGVWQSGTFRATANQVNLIDAIGNNFLLTGVQLEVGNTAGTFEHRHFQQELALCQRYYEVGRASGRLDTVSTTTLGYPIGFKVPMRSSPTIAFGTPVSNFGLRDGPFADNPDTFGFTLRLSGVADYGWVGPFTASAEL